MDDGFIFAAAVACESSGPEAGAGPPSKSFCQPTLQLPPSPSRARSRRQLPKALAAEVVFEGINAQDEAVFLSPEKCSTPSHLRPFCEDRFIHNLDTGQCRRLGEGALTNSFLQGDPIHPSELVAGLESLGSWASWRSEKRASDDQLGLALESGSLDLLRQALKKPEDVGAPRSSVNSRSLYGRTALHIGASVGKAESVELLLDAGVDIEAVTDTGLTPLHIASQRGHLSVAALLLDWGAGACPENDDRNLPIHLAAKSGHVSIIRLLIRHGGHGQLFFRNSMGQGPLDVSMDIHTADVIKVLETEAPASVKSNSHPASDTYAGRTPFRQGAVLLHNSRSDAVHRLLRATQNKPCLQNECNATPIHKKTKQWSANKEAAEKEKSSQHSRSRPSNNELRGSRGPFASVRHGSGIEKVGPDSFLHLRRLGKGSFGEVFLVRHAKTQQDFAMKILRKSTLNKTGNLLRYAMTERNVLSYVRHPYMVSMHYAFQTRAFLVLVLEFCPGGNLQQLIERLKRLDDTLAQLYTAEILLALIHLHERKILHRDMKPDNVVIDKYGHAMLTDFGLSKEGVSAITGSSSFCGSVAYLAPEILFRKAHRHTVDIYGLGVLLFTMLTGRPPFYHPVREEIHNNIKHSSLIVPPCVPHLAAALICRLVARDPLKRIGAADTKDVKKHEYFSDIDFDALMRREVSAPRALVLPYSSWPRGDSATPFYDLGNVGVQEVPGWSFSNGSS